MGQFSSWNLRFRRLDEGEVQFDIDRINVTLANSDMLQSGIEEFFPLPNSNITREAYAEWETTSYHAQDDIENDMRLLSETYPHLVFQCDANIDDGDPSFYINAQGGELEWSYPEIVYPGFKHIFYDKEDKSSCPYSQDDLKLSISDMEKLTEMVKAKAPDGTFDTGSATTEIAAWALKAVLEIYYGEVIK